MTPFRYSTGVPAPPGFLASTDNGTAAVAVATVGTAVSGIPNDTHIRR
jgi:hypothetical protein